MTVLRLLRIVTYALGFAIGIVLGTVLVLQGVLR